MAEPCEGVRCRAPDSIKLQQARWSIADKVDEWTLETALSRHRRNQDIGRAIDLLCKNYQLRKATMPAA